MNSRFILLTFVFYLSACSASPIISERVVSTAPPPSPTAAIAVSVLYRADAGRQGVYDEPAIRKFSGLKWQKSFDEDSYFPIYAEGTLYIGTSSGKLLALDPDSGQERWSFATKGGPLLAVAVSEGLVYFGAGEKGFYAVDGRSGKLAWLFETDSSVWSSSPLIMDGLIYFGSDRGTVYCLDQGTHEVVWMFKAASGVLSQIAGDTERVYVPTQNDLYALDAATGSEVWKAFTSDKWNEPAVSDGVVYAGRGDRSFVALNAEKGEEQWVFTAPSNQWSEWSAPVVTEAAIYVGYSDKTMFALEPETGKERWGFKTEDWATTAPILTDGVLYFGVGAHANQADDKEDRPFYALDADSGDELWNFKADGLIFAAATVGNGAVYFKTLNHQLYALQ